MISEPTILCPGVTARPTSRQVVVVDIDPAADPIGLPPELLERERARLGGQRNPDGTWTDSWRFRREYMRDFSASGGREVFPGHALDWQRGNLRDALCRMDLAATGELVRRDRGRLLVWIEPDSQPPNLPEHVLSARRAYGIGMDVAGGTGASDSVVEGFTTDTREQVCELADNRIQPAELGRFAAAVGRLYHDAMICCPSRMHGLTALRTMRDECGYGPLWHHKIMTTPHERLTERLGWARGETSDEYLMGQWIDAMIQRTTILHGLATLEQHRAWVYDEAGRMVHRDLVDQPVEIRRRHGDRVVGCALAWRACADGHAWRPTETVRPTGREEYVQEQLARQRGPWRR